MTENAPIAFGDNVRVRKTPLTEKLGLDSLTGAVYGETTPSRTSVEVIGELKDDYAIAVDFEDREESLWFAPHLLELVDHASGTEMTFKGVDGKLVRNESGEWELKAGSPRDEALLSKIKRLFKPWR